MNMKNAKGFTLIELMIVIIIIGILATVSVPMYRNYTKKAMASEGVALLGAVASAERVYFAEHNTFTNNTSVDIAVNAGGNKYFTAFTMGTVSGTQFTVTTAGSGDANGISVTYIGNSAAAPTTSIAGL